MRGQNRLPKPMETKNDEMRCPQPDTNVDECYVQERHNVDTAENWFHFPPPLLVSTQLFLENKLEGDSMCLSCKFFLQTNPS